jgi:hypothetical protein
VLPTAQTKYLHFCSLAHLCVVLSGRRLVDEDDGIHTGLSCGEDYGIRHGFGEVNIECLHSMFTRFVFICVKFSSPNKKCPSRDSCVGLGILLCQSGSPYPCSLTAGELLRHTVGRTAGTGRGST